MSSKTIADLEEQRARLEARKAQLEARIKAAKAREAAAARKARTHALVVMGAMIADAAAGGDWTTIDMAKLLSWMHAHADELSSAVAVIGPTDEVSAGKRMRAWERAVRERRTANGAEKGDEAGQASLPIDEVAAGGEG